MNCMLVPHNLLEGVTAGGPSRPSRVEDIGFFSESRVGNDWCCERNEDWQ